MSELRPCIWIKKATRPHLLTPTELVVAQSHVRAENTKMNQMQQLPSRITQGSHDQGQAK